MFEDIFLRIPKVTPHPQLEARLLEHLSSDKKAKAFVMDIKINSISIGREAHYDWEISKLIQRFYLLFFVVLPKRE